MNLLIITLIATMSNIWVHWIVMPMKSKRLKFKPLNCESCLALWAALIYFVRLKFIWQGFLLGVLSYVLSIVISRIFVKYLNVYYARFRNNRKA